MSDFRKANIQRFIALTTSKAPRPPIIYACRFCPLTTSRDLWRLLDFECLSINKLPARYTSSDKPQFKLLSRLQLEFSAK